jgi:hypothetical protein
MLKHVFPFLVGSLAFVACTSANPSNGDDDSSGTGGTNNPGTGGGTGAKGGTGAGGTSNPGTGGTGTGGTSNPGTGGTGTGGAGGTGTGGTGTGGTGTGGTGTGGTVSMGGMGATGGSMNMSGAGGSAGMAMVTCSNTDKSIIPIDATGWVDKTCDACGIQGAFYWYADDNTKASLMCNGAACVANTPPYQAGAPGPGMCISGKATGMSADWGAGIGLSLNDSGGTTSVKGAFDATTAACGNITGFDITLTGNTGGMPVRIGFTTTGDGTTIAPFIPVGDPAGTTLMLSGSQQIVIKNAVIPADWKSTDPSPPDPSKIYDLQIQVAADQATAGTAFDLCVTDIKPVTDGSGGSMGGSSCKSSSVGSISTATGVQPLGSSGLGYQNNVNNPGSGSQSVTGAYGSGCGSLVVNTTGIKSNNNSPASYPSLVDGWHWGSWNGAYSQGSVKALSALTSVKSSYAFTPPAGNKWDVSYDMWVAQSPSISAPDGNTLEVMVWLDYSNMMTTNPIGSKLTTSFTAAGTTWEVWYGSTGSWHTVSYRRTPGTTPVQDFDLLQFLKDAVTHGTGSTSWDLLSVEAGFELFDATSGGSVDSYSCSIN